MALFLLMALLLAQTPDSQAAIRVLKLSDGGSLKMGKVDSWRILYPDMKCVAAAHRLLWPGDSFTAENPPVPGGH